MKSNLIRNKAPKYWGPNTWAPNPQIFSFPQNLMVSNFRRGHPDFRTTLISKMRCKIKSPRDPQLTCKLLIFNTFWGFGTISWRINTPICFFTARSSNIRYSNIQYCDMLHAMQQCCMALQHIKFCSNLERTFFCPTARPLNIDQCSIINWMNECWCYHYFRTSVFSYFGVSAKLQQNNHGKFTGFKEDIWKCF